MADNDKGKIVKGTVKSMDAKAAVIDLGNDIEGILKSSEISRDKVEDVRNVLKEGEEVEVKVISVDRKNRVISLSIKAKDVHEEKEAVRQHRDKEAVTESVTTIGGLIKAKLDDK